MLYSAVEIKESFELTCSERQSTAQLNGHVSHVHGALVIRCEFHAHPVRYHAGEALRAGNLVRISAVLDLLTLRHTVSFNKGKGKRYARIPEDRTGRCWSPVSEEHSPHVTIVSNRYFLPSPRLPSHRPLSVLLLGKQRHLCVRMTCLLSLRDSVTNRD